MQDANVPKYDFLELRTRAEFLELCGDEEGAAELRDLSLKIAREVDLTCYAYQLMWRDRLDDAISLLQLNASVNPQSWNVQDSLGEAFEMKGDLAAAVEHYRGAAELVDDEAQRERIKFAIDRIVRMERAVS